MKAFHFLKLITGMVLLSLFLNSCEDKIDWTKTYVVNVPVYKSYSEFRKDINISAPRDLVKPGKIAMYGNYLLINEISEGIHVIDNSNPSNPKNVGFLEIPGSREMGIKDDLLFTENQIDLVCFDISNPAQAKSISRTENLFNYFYYLPPTNNYYPIDEIDQEKGVIVGWELKKVERKVDTEYRPYPCYDCYYSDLASSSGNKGPSSIMVSKLGSMSQFTVNGDYLYIINFNYQLKTFHIENNKATHVSDLNLQFYAESIFYYNNNLFIGSNRGFAILSVENPRMPSIKSFVAHILGCDPVVVQGKYAYSTIRGGNICGQQSSLLEVTDISDTANPKKISSFPMIEPYGLAIDGNTLFVCDKGLVVYDATDPFQIGKKQLALFSSINGFDVIAYNNVLMMIGSDGLYQYDYSNLKNIRQISSISIKK